MTAAAAVVGDNQQCIRGGSGMQQLVLCLTRVAQPAVLQPCFLICVVEELLPGTLCESVACWECIQSTNVLTGCVKESV